MAGLETVVRPVVFPDIRPAPPRSLPPVDDPEKGFAVIKGQPAKQVDLTYSYSMSASSSHVREKQRTVDTARIYQEEEDGTVNKENFVDVDDAFEYQMEGPTIHKVNDSQGHESGTADDGDTVVSTERITYKEYRRRLKVEAYKNIEIIGHEKVIKNMEAQGL